ncbi:hypothetical protein [Thalassococcus sp. S3]|uniref:hypothetical protein n=1 Tax=Thalassococcus sp. S3 TaxID=2017482 RepID=UPI001024676B|nr:hypothetical protein [Thalassococcus sp. S3]QBF32341.1 hypothetical protein CFI11_14120 [Thalassococcus sp. S3]
MSTKTTNLGFCAVCQHITDTPCVPDLDFPVDGLALTQPLAVPMTDVVRAKSKTELLRPDFFCKTGKELVRRRLKPQELRDLVSYKIFEGLHHGVRYEHPWGSELDIGPDTIEEVFDGREQVALPADVESWADEPISYDRAISDWLRKAKEGLITDKPYGTWHKKLMFIDLALRTPNFDPRDLD